MAKFLYRYRMVIGMLFVLLANTSSFATEIMRESFDSYTVGSFPSSGGWQQRFSGAGQQIDDSQSWSSLQSFKLEGLCNSASEAYIMLPSTSPVMRLSAKVRLQLLENQCLPYQDALIGFQNSGQYATTYYALAFSNGIAGGSVPFNYDQWYTVTVEINTSNKTYSTWLDYQPVDCNISYTGPDPDAITITSHNARQTRTWYDEIVVESVPQILYDNFDSYAAGAFPPGWQLQTDGFGTPYQVVDNAQSTSIPNSLKLEGACNWAAQASHSIGTTASILRMEADVRLDLIEAQCLQYQDAIIAFQSSSSPPSTIYGIDFANGSVGPLSFDYSRWYHVRIEIDNQNQKLSAWLGCDPIVIGQSLSGFVLPDQILLTSHNSRHNRAWYDNVSVTEVLPDPIGLSNAPFCSNFEFDALGLQPASWQRIYGNQLVVDDPVHDGAQALKFEGFDNGCHSVIKRIEFVADVGEYSTWFQQQRNASTGLQGLYVKVQPGDDPHPDLRVGYVVRLNASNSANGGFLSLSKLSGGGGSTYNQEVSSDFVTGEWIRAFIRIYPGGFIEAGYEKLSGQRKSIFWQDPDPISQPGEFYVASCVDGSSPANYVDDICYQPTFLTTYATCNDFEDAADLYADFVSTRGTQTISNSMSYSGASSLACSGSSVTYAKDLVLEVGMASAWMNQQDHIGDMRIFTQVQPLATDPISVNGYALILSGADAEVPRFMLAKYTDGIPDTLAKGSPQFSKNEWVRGFIYRGQGGELIAGYESLDGIKYVLTACDLDPILEPGLVYLWTYAPSQPNYFDDLCIDPYAFSPFVFGDADGSGSVSISDAVYMINYIFAGGPAPNPLRAGDANDDASTNITDCVYLVNYIFAGGPAPVRPCGSSTFALARGHAATASTSATANAENHLLVNTSSGTPIQALQLNFAPTGQIADFSVNCIDPRFQVFSGWVDGEYRVGVIDLTGKTTLPAGTHDLLTISYEGDGELVLTSAIVVDSDAREMNVTISSSKSSSTLPTEFALAQNRPNPFNPSTEISFSLPKPAEVTLSIYNILGESVATLAEGLRTAGTHAVTWDGRDKNGRVVASGVYFYRLDAGEFSATRKMLLLK